MAWIPLPARHETHQNKRVVPAAGYKGNATGPIRVRNPRGDRSTPAISHSPVTVTAATEARYSTGGHGNCRCDAYVRAF
jgi:hypothetical protein